MRGRRTKVSRGTRAAGNGGWRNARDYFVSVARTLACHEPAATRRGHGSREAKRVPRRDQRRPGATDSRSRGSSFFPRIRQSRESRATYPKSAMAMSLTLYSRPATVSMEHIAVGADIFVEIWREGGAEALRESGGREDDRRRFKASRKSVFGRPRKKPVSEEQHEPRAAKSTAWVCSWGFQARD